MMMKRRRRLSFPGLHLIRLTLGGARERKEERGEVFIQGETRGRERKEEKKKHI